MVQNLRELKPFKLNQFQRTQLQTFNEKRKTSYKHSLLPYWKEYCDNSSIHCLRYLTDTKMQKCEKMLWFLIILATTSAAIYVYFKLTELYYSQRIQTTIANSVYPVLFIPFPAIAICTRNRINWPKLQTAHLRFLPSNASEEAIITFRWFIETLEDLRFGKFDSLSILLKPNVSGRGEDLRLIDNVNVREVMEYLAFGCDEAFDMRKCWWRRRVYNCCELFTLERTELGFCHVFNSEISEEEQKRAKEDKYYPYHNGKAGDSSGLEVEMLLDETKMRPGFKRINGVYVMAKHSQQWSHDARFINMNTFTKIGITLQFTDTHATTRAVGPDIRQCLFADEHNSAFYKTIPGLPYWRGNCRTRCHQEYLLKYCNCSTSLMFPEAKAEVGKGLKHDKMCCCLLSKTDKEFVFYFIPTDNFSECKPVDFVCIYKQKDFLSVESHSYESQFIDDVLEESMVCNCLNSCNQLMLDYSFTSVPLEGVNASDSVKRVHLDIHYQKDNIIMYNTRMRYTLVELVANFGGIIGLFLGASLLSAVELGYYCSIGLCTRLRKPNRLSCRTRNRFKILKVKQQKNNNEQVLKSNLQKF